MDKRKRNRIAVELPASVTTGATVTGVMVRDGSAGGAMIEVSARFPYGVALILKIGETGEFGSKKM